MINIPFQSLIDQSIAKKNKDRDKKTQTSWYISSIGACMRGNYLSRLGVEPDIPFTKRVLRIFDMGNKVEDWVVSLLKEQEGYIIDTQVRVEDEKLNVSGYADVMITNKKTKEEKIYEIKSKHSRSFHWMDKKGQGAQREHEYQLWTYLYLLGIDEGSIVYISKDDSCILEYPVKRDDEEIKKEVFDYLNLMNKAWKEKDPRILPLPDQNAWQGKYCSYHKKCLEIDKNIDFLKDFAQ
jgi:hypothetical protein